MRKFVTEKFLWDLYGFLEKTKNIVEFIIASPYQKARMIDPGRNPIFEKYKKDMGRRKFSRLVYNLKKNNYIKSNNLKSKKAVVITKKGLDKILKVSFKFEKRKRRKDGKWIMLIFDIPQRYGKSRKLMRSILKNMGYKIFQQSVWITPYDVSEETEKLLQLYSLDSFVRIFIIEEI